MDEARRKIAAQLEPLSAAGWEIEIDSEGSEGALFYLDHPLSSRSGFSLTTGQAVQNIVKTILSSREVAVIASAPKDTPHVNLLGEIRRTAQAWEWPDTVLPQLAVALFASDVIAHDEMEWLVRAGAVRSLA